MDNEIYKGWLNFYKKAHSIENPVKYSVDEKGKKVRLPLDPILFEDFIKQTGSVLDKSSAYLNSRGVTAPAPLWKYDQDDPTTHLSSRSFAYYHLVK